MFKGPAHTNCLEFKVVIPHLFPNRKDGLLALGQADTQTSTLWAAVTYRWDQNTKEKLPFYSALPMGTTKY